MAILWRVRPRKARGSLFTQLIARDGHARLDEWANDGFFGIVGQATTGQGSSTTDISASAAASAAAVTAGQGSATSDITAGINSNSALDTGQGSATSDGIGAVPFLSTVDTGTGDQLTDIVVGLTAFQQIKPQGFFDNGIVTPIGERSFWRINVRTENNFFQSFVLRNTGDASPSVADDCFFTDTTYDGVGAQDVAYGTIHISPPGIASTVAFGTPVVYNYNQSVYPTGISSTVAFGTTRVENYFRYLYPTSIASSLSFGTATIANRNRTLTLSGINSAAYGMAHIYDPAQFARPLGFNYQSWGTASVTLKNKYLSPSGTMFSAYGTASLQNKNRYILAQRIDPKGFGTATIYNKTQYKYMTGFQDDVFGTPYIIGPRYINASGWKADVISTLNAVSNYYRSIYPSSVPVTFPATGNSTIYNEDKIIFPDDIEPPEMFGAVVATPPFNIIDVTGNSISESEVTSEADIYYGNRNHLYVRNTVFADKIGRPTVTPATVTINGGITSNGYGLPTVSNYTRYLLVNSSNGAFGRYGTPWVSHYIRNVYPRGFDSSVVWYAFGPINQNGTVPGVKGSTVTIYPDGFDASGTTYDPCGFPRTPPIPRPSVHP